MWEGPQCPDPARRQRRFPFHEYQRMNADELKSSQAPLKAQYRERPETALITLRAEGRIGENVTCKIETGKARRSWTSSCDGRRWEERLFGRHAARSPRGLRRRDTERGRYRSEHSVTQRHHSSGGRSRFSRDTRRLQRCTRRVQTNSIAFRFGYRRQRGTARHIDTSD